MSNTFCPLYDKAIAEKPWKQKQTAHAGLLFDKFPSFWQPNSGEYKFEKSDFLNDFISVSFDASLINEACQRQRNMVKKLGGEIIVLKNSSRFITGMGREHPLENGFTWHHTLGVPFLPGSSLKGLLRAWFRESCGEIVQNKKGHDFWQEDDKTEKFFGSQEEGVGKFICLDMLPLEKPTLVVEMMTPHYGPYYQDDTGKTAPGDWHNPVPIPFLAVEAETAWQIAVIPGPAHRTINKADLGNLITEIPEALSWLGAGAKTAVGYGRFEHDKEKENDLKKEDEKRIEEIEKKRKREEALSALSPSRRILEERSEKESWATDNSAFLQSMENFFEEQFEFDHESINWIKSSFLETKWKGIWENPDAKKGKKKDKPRFNIRGAKIVHKLKEIINSLSENE